MSPPRLKPLSIMTAMLPRWPCLPTAATISVRTLNGVAALCGEAGVAHAIQLLSDEVRRDMALLGVTEIAGLDERYLMRA